MCSATWSTAKKDGGFHIKHPKHIYIKFLNDRLICGIKFILDMIFWGYPYKLIQRFLYIMNVVAISEYVLRRDLIDTKGKWRWAVKAK